MKSESKKRKLKLKDLLPAVKKVMKLTLVLARVVQTIADLMG